MHTLLQDSKYAIRNLLRNRMFTIVAIGALAIGIGANTAIFSVVNGVLLRPLPFRDPGELVVVLQKSLRSGADHMPVAPASYTDVKQQNRSFASCRRGGNDGWVAHWRWSAGADCRSPDDSICLRRARHAAARRPCVSRGRRRTWPSSCPRLDASAMAAAIRVPTRRSSEKP